jgi:NitT/TauT family transport system substrate-binding protein
MSIEHARWISRRRLLGGLTLAGTAGLLGLRPRPAGAEPPPETTKLTLVQVTGLCVAPQYVAEALLAGEGFTDVRYMKTEGGDEYSIIASGEAQLSMAFVAPFLMSVDTGHPIVLLGGSMLAVSSCSGLHRSAPSAT